MLCIKKKLWMYISLFSQFFSYNMNKDSLFQNCWWVETEISRGWASHNNVYKESHVFVVVDRFWVSDFLNALDLIML